MSNRFDKYLLTHESQSDSAYCNGSYANDSIYWIARGKSDNGTEDAHTHRYYQYHITCGVATRRSSGQFVSTRGAEFSIAGD